MNEKKIPTIRFQGFTDDWEQQTLGNILITLPFKPYMKSPEQNGKYEIIQQGNEPIAGYANGSPCLNYTDLVIFGDHTLSLFKPESPFFVATDGVRILKGKDNMNRNYLYVLLQKHKPESEGYKRYYSILAKCKIWLTMNSNEQNRTGILFATLDNLIALHQRKLTKLQLLKKSMLTKMFPKDGAYIPQIRFQGFHENWKRYKLGDIVDFLDTQRRPLTENIREKGPYPYYGASGIVDYVAGYLFDEELILLSEDGANITDRSYPVCFLASGKYWVNNHAHVLRSKTEMDNNFICNAMERKDYSNYNSGMAMPKLNQDTCRHIPVECPSYPEQKLIGKFFRELDNRITIHQQKLSKLKQIKQAMLSKLFI